MSNATLSIGGVEYPVSSFEFTSGPIEYEKVSLGERSIEKGKLTNFKINAEIEPEFLARLFLSFYTNKNTNWFSKILIRAAIIIDAFFKKPKMSLHDVKWPRK
jgi:hypothetical protein